MYSFTIEIVYSRYLAEGVVGLAFCAIFSV
jgi:hypothetical protein